jgi:hypothetical protein
MICEDGGVYAMAFSPYPCCKMGDPWPLSGPECTSGSPPIYSCPSKKCGVPDPRYQTCLGWLNKGQLYPLRDVAEVEHLLKLYCFSNPIVPGHPCRGEDGCRPAAAEVSGRLICDVVNHLCVQEPREPASVEYGTSCGVAASDLSDKTSTRDQVVAGKTCSYCHVLWDDYGQCVRQGCTQQCQYDEDCPAGSICLCALSDTDVLMQFCAGATGRTAPLERAHSLPCCSCADAGASADSALPDAGPD